MAENLLVTMGKALVKGNNMSKIETSHPINGLMLAKDVYTAIVIFNQAFYAYEKALLRLLRPAKLTISQAIVLGTLVFTGSSMTLTKISRYLPIEKPAVSLVIDSLVKRKLIRRRHSNIDRRYIDIYNDNGTRRGSNKVDGTGCTHSVDRYI